MVSNDWVIRCDHCWHEHQGSAATPTGTLVPKLIEQCCKCHQTRVVHGAHQ